MQMVRAPLQYINLIDLLPHLVPNCLIYLYKYKTDEGRAKQNKKFEYENEEIIILQRISCHAQISSFEHVRRLRIAGSFMTS